ncbi:hypothetical protein VTI74DRAFT_1647 [Chaetomium olivicolor]
MSDRELLDIADTATLLARVRAMREAGQIPEDVRRDVFLVVDKDVFCNEQFVKAIPISLFNPRGTIWLGVLDPDHDPSPQPVPAEGPFAGFDGEIAVPLLKMLTGSEGKEAKSKKTEGTKANGMRWWDKTVMPYPRYEL